MALVPSDKRLTASPRSPSRRRAHFAIGPQRSGSTSSLVKAALYQSMHGRSQSLPFIQRPAQRAANKEINRLRVDALTTILSGLYAKLLVVLGVAFPMAETISAHVPASFYEGFYVFLYAGSMLFLLLLYCCLLKERALDSVVQSHQAESGGRRRKISATASAPRSRYGSFYLRMGAVAFGIGSMIYSGLEFGQFFELEKNPKCYNVMLSVTPIARMIFIIMQMQFIFLSNKQLKVRTYHVPMRFGLMHMIACNVCVWLNVLIQETKHEIIALYSTSSELNSVGGEINATITTTEASPAALNSTTQNTTLLNATHSNVGSEFGRLKGLQDLRECRRSNIMGSLVQNASPFLFPCTIEYSLICAVILYAMWKDVNAYSRGRQSYSGAYGNKISTTKAPSALQPALYPGGQSGQQISVDCASAHKGLFAGVLVLVLTILSLILFCVLSRDRALLQINACELTLYSAAVIATLLSMWRMRHLEYDTCRRFELDNMLLVTAQTGLYVYTLFSIIAGYFSAGTGADAAPGVVVMSVSALLQTTLQTVFILDAWWRRCGNPAQARAKPGRQLVTFLLVTNMALWAVSRLQNSRADFHPVELRFYGFWVWTIITHVAMPLAVFYRFHSTVCLCEIWKSAYKMRLPVRK
ncbi:proton channel OtopLc-like [Schistocerca nitens]|uniref:proton channel OtopLc-like n=1 Tax=Schistocerca nitens TaxID=7011 RepID=UPI002117A59A|nr:proton channel OtopLc-like [Schistocerca nitens]